MIPGICSARGGGNVPTLDAPLFFFYIRLFSLMIVFITPLPVSSPACLMGSDDDAGALMGTEGREGASPRPQSRPLHNA